eukprot:4264242-Heterocapsa_arctica.AAC.1
MVREVDHELRPVGTGLLVPHTRPVEPQAPLRSPVSQGRSSNRARWGQQLDMHYIPMWTHALARDNPSILPQRSCVMTCNGMSHMFG